MNTEPNLPANAPCVGCGDPFLRNHQDEVRCGQCIAMIIRACGSVPTTAVLGAMRELSPLDGWLLAVTPQHVVDLLNDALVQDKQCIERLVAARVECNDALANHPTIQCGAGSDRIARVGLIGVLNGIFGAERGRGLIGFEAPNESTPGQPCTISRFMLLTHEDFDREEQRENP